jgi:hypothetical protein
MHLEILPLSGVACLALVALVAGFADDAPASDAAAAEVASFPGRRVMQQIFAGFLMLFRAHL